ncbi:MAG: T9SS type B sorting domain-containing protein, partial [Flavisolibacter sp.]
AGSCNTWTFQTELTSSQAERPNDIVQLPSASYVICGVTGPGSNVFGHLIKVSADGQVLASKELKLAGYQVLLNRLHYFAIGKLYGIGTISDSIHGWGAPALFNIDTGSLVVQSVTRLNETSGSLDWKGFDMAESSMDSTMYVLLHNDSLINVTKFKADLSTLVWSKTYRPKNAPKPVGIGIEALDVFVAWNETDSSYSKGVVANLDPNTGNFRYGSKVGGPSQKLNVALEGMCVVNLRPRFTSVEWDNTSTRFVRINYEVFAYPTFKEYFTVAGLNPSPGTLSQQNAWGESIAVQQTVGTNGIFVIQTFPDNDNNSPIKASLVNYPSGVRLARQALSLDGGSITLCESIKGIIISKQDSSINLPSCNTSEVAASSLRTLTKQDYLLDTLSPRTLVFQPSPVSIAQADLPLNENYSCKTQYCPTVKEPDSCQRTFFKEYRNSTNSITCYGISKLGNDFLLTGQSRSLPYSGGGSFSLMKLDTLGRVKDARLVWGPNLYAYKTIGLHDGNFLLFGSVGSTFTFSELYFAKIDPQFNVIWQEKLTSNPFFNGVSAVVESQEGDLYCYLADHETTNAESRDIMKLDANGKPVWLQKFNVSPNIFAGTGEFIPGIVELGDNVVLKYNMEDADMSPFLMSLRKSDGAMNWARKYQMQPPFGGSNTYSLSGLVSDGHNIYMVGRTQDHDLFLKIRPDGNVALAKKVVKGTAYASAMATKPNGRLLVDVGSFSAPVVNGVIEMDTSFNVLRSQYMHAPKWGGFGGVVDVNDSLVYEAGSLWSDDPYWSSVSFAKFNFNSSFSACTVTDPVFVLDTVSQPVLIKTNPQTNVPLPIQNPVTAGLFPLDFNYAAYYCGNNPLCSNVQLQGPAKICDSSNVYSFRVVRNPGCTGFVIWKMDTSARQVQIVSVTDSVLRLKAIGGGSFKIHSKVFATCGWLEDSISVQASLQNTSLYLGKDTMLCKGNSLQLHAGPSFVSYQWQDGSADSVFTLKQPGTYYVTVSSCNNILSDTVLVSPHPPIPFDAGADRVKCNTDTVHLDATAGFLNYSWSPNYRISSSTAADIIVNPLVDTTYYVKAEKSPGCFAYDTVRVKVYTSPKIDLGSDTSFCAGNSIQLSAPATFSSYRWSTGETAQQINVSRAGSYVLVATTANGCLSSDTLVVNNIYPLPVVNLDKSPTLCYGTSRLLDPGSFSAYLWQNGSTGRNQSVSGTGTYYVKVWDQHSCSNTDTVRITTVLPLPLAFLPADTSLCSYETLSLKPNTPFQQYLWNTGAITSSISVSRPGLYWLLVTDSKGCKGTDSIMVNSKECMAGVYVPTAFSPNDDGRNDDFKAMAFGNIKSFELTVYNRWGEIIFKTNDRFKGWNGKFGGMEQRSDVYIWTCRYRFEGEGEQVKKGTVTLLR